MVANYLLSGVANHGGYSIAMNQKKRHKSLRRKLLRQNLTTFELHLERVPSCLARLLRISGGESLLSHLYKLLCKGKTAPKNSLITHSANGP